MLVRNYQPRLSRYPFGTGSVAWQTFRPAFGMLFAVVIAFLTAASNAADTLYVSVDSASSDVGAIDTISPGGSVSTFVSDLANPSGLAFGSGGSLYVSTSASVGSDITILQINQSLGVNTFVSGIDADYLNGLAFDRNNNLYVGLDGLGIDKVTPSAIVSTFGTAIGQNVAFDSQGNLYSAAAIGGVIYKTTPSGSSSNFSASLNSPLGLAFDGKGDLFVSDESDDTITEFTPSGSSSVFASLANSVSPFPAGSTVTYYGLAFDTSGKLYVAEGDGTTGAIGVTTGGVIDTYATMSGIPKFIADPSVTLPVPEPAAVGLLFVTVVAVPMARRRRRSARRDPSNCIL